jgi:hypothetical protein
VDSEYQDGDGSGKLKQRTLIRSSVEFQLKGLPGISTVSDVFFFYGTSTSEPDYSGTRVRGAPVGDKVPEPGVIVLLLTAVAVASDAFSLGPNVALNDRPCVQL